MKRRNCIQVSIAPSPGPLHSIHRITLFVKYFFRNSLKKSHFKIFLLFFTDLHTKKQPFSGTALN